MRQWSRILIAGIVFLPMLLFADDYTIARVAVDATINRDGTVRYVEHRTYQYDGDFTWANYALPKSGFTEMTDIRVSDQSQQYTHENSEDPHTFQVTTNENEINIKWFYRAEDETKTFTIEYTLHDALAVGPEWSQFQSTYISNKWKKTTRAAQIRLALPEVIPADSIYNWVHGVRSKASLTVQESSVAIRANDIRSSEYLQVKTLFPTRVLAHPDTTEPELSLAAVRETEQEHTRQVQEAMEQQAENRRLGLYLTLGIALVSLLVWLYFYRKYGVRHKPKGIPKTLYNLPTDDPPAIVGWLVQSKTVSGSHLVATLFDLARRGYFHIVQEEGEKKFLREKEDRFRILSVAEEDRTDSVEELNPWERDLYDYVTESMEDDGIYFDDLTDQRSMMSKWFREWSKAVKEDADSRGWYDEESKRGAIYCGIIQSVLFLGGLGTVALADVIGLIGTAAAFVFGLLSIVIYRRTPEGETVYRQWAAFKKGLKAMKSRQRGEANIDTLFVYAIAIGLGEEELKKWLSSVHLEDSTFPWIVFLPGMLGHPAEIATSMSTLAGTGLQSVTSVAGGTGATGASSVGGAGGGAG